MAVNLSEPKFLHPVEGVRLGIAEAAIKGPGRKDLVVIALDEGSRVAGIFTRNAFCAPPVSLCRERLAASTPIRAMLILSLIHI